jgi:hypothetical protein
MKKEDFFNIALPKWPALIVRGEKITTDQAAEIIIRTTDHLSCNSSEFVNACQSLIYDVQIPTEKIDRYDAVTESIMEKIGADEKDWESLWKYKENKHKELGILEDLFYLGNERICSSWIGGPHGWCDWDGTIGCSNYNIGKWPTVQEVYEGWQLIAKAFPYLNLRCQLANHGASETDGITDPRPLVEFIVKDGKVKMIIPKNYITVPEFGPFINIGDRGSEIGCTLDQFFNALTMVKRKMEDQKVQ